MTDLIIFVLKELLRRLLLKVDHLPPLRTLKKRHQSYLDLQLEGQAAKEGRAGNKRNCGVYAKSVRHLPYHRLAELKLALWLWGGLMK